MKTSELQGAALDWAVAKCEGQVSDSVRFMAIFTHQNKTKQGYCYSIDWSQGGPIIERERMDVWTHTNKEWASSIDKGRSEYRGPTPLIAAMRCYVASKLGDEVEVPDELLEKEV
jgi:hypothetical protein